MDHPRISLEQWRSLLAVVEAGGYAQAAEALHKSQSAVTYAVQKLESLLGVKAFEIQGRKAVLTPAGQMLYRRARALLEEAGGLEHAARTLSAGWEAEIGVAADIIFPSWLMVECLARFSAESPHTHVEVYESVLEGTAELLLTRRVQVALASSVPQGFLGDVLMTMNFVAAAHPDHPLHKVGRKLRYRDLQAHRHLVVRDTATTRSKETQTLDSQQRWTFSHMSTSIQAAQRGYGFAWYPEYRIRDEIAEGLLKPLPLAEGSLRSAPLYLIVADGDAAGPGARRLADIIRQEVSGECKRANDSPGIANSESRPNAENRKAARAKPRRKAAASGSPASR